MLRGSWGLRIVANRCRAGTSDFCIIAFAIQGEEETGSAIL
jgi:hypothetical protein